MAFNKYMLGHKRLRGRGYTLEKKAALSTLTYY